MPNQPRAESAVVRPAPPTAEAILELVLHLSSPIGFDSPPTTTDSFMAGIEFGLALGLDRPDTLPLVLSSIDGVRQSRETDEQFADNLDARAEIVDLLGDIATGRKQPPSSSLPSFEWPV